MNRFEKAKRYYQSIEIPAELNDVIEDALSATPRKKKHRIASKVLLSAACLLIVFTTALNASEVFAQSVYNIPVLGEFARVITWREYRQHDDYRLIDVKVPQLANTGNTALEKRVNNEIQKKIDEIITRTEQEAKELYQLYVDEGRENEYHKLEVSVDYEIKCSDQRTTSFVLTKFETFASANVEQFFYNVDLQTGKDITLQDLLGPKYKEIADKSIQAQIEQRKAEDENNIFFDGTDGIEGFTGISEDQNFYINEQGNPVVVFEKYEIAPGYMGIQEFEISVK